MTLLELVVYIILAAFLLAPVLFLTHNSSVNTARDNSNTALRSIGKDVLNTIYEDVKNTGYKVSFTTTPPLVLTTISDAYYSDQSSFRHINSSGTFYDELVIRKGVLDNSGTFLGVDTVSYFVNSEQELIRKVHGISAVSGLEQKVAFNVEALQFQYSADLVNWDDDPPNTIPKPQVKYIKVFIALNDNSNLSPSKGGSKITVADIELPSADQALREIHEITVPVPNNGLFPPS